jgi:hypothetical protein
MPGHRPLVRRTIDLTVAAIGAVLGFMAISPAAPASAHTSSTYYYTSSPLGKWPGSHLEPYYVRNGFPSSAYVSRISESDDVWNAASGSSLVEPDFSYSGTTGLTGNFDSPCSISWSGVYYRSLAYLGSGTRAATKACKNTSGITQNFQLSVSITSETPWYTGTGIPSSTQWDLKSLVTHEFGHATAFWGHFTDVCPVSDSRQTMCVGFDARGTTYLRTLGTHDIHTFTGAY